jgi:hypothetical protein
MDFLDIPADVQGQLKPREVAPELTGDVPVPPEETESPPPPTGEEPSRDEEVGEEEPEEEPEPEPAAAPEEQPRLDKRQKRINRLTRQKSELQTKLDTAYRQAEEMRQQLEQIQRKQQEAAGAAPPTVGRLGWITSEQQLAQEVDKANSVIDWCDQNPDGVTSGSGENQEYVDSEKIARWRREAEKVVINAPMREKELQRFGEAQNHYTRLVQENWPELLDKSTPDHQMAVEILKFYPWLAQTPQAWYAAGLVIEGAKALDVRNAAKANGQRQHRDIDERAFAPRVPLSPHVANPPTRTATPSSKQRLNEAMSNLVKDTDGSASSLAGVFGAMDAARPQRTSGKTPVRS